VRPSATPAIRKPVTHKQVDRVLRRYEDDPPTAAMAVLSEVVGQPYFMT
jgi:hypothetical protein